MQSLPPMWHVVFLIVVSFATHAVVNESADFCLGENLSDCDISAALPDRLRDEQKCDELRKQRFETGLVVDFLATWARNCSSSELAHCEELAEEPSWLFDCACRIFIENEEGQQRLGLLLIRHAANLASAAAWKESTVFNESVPCRQPANVSEVSRRFDDDLLATMLVPGRRCQDGSCPPNCLLTIFGSVLPTEDVHALLDHGEMVVEKLRLDQNKKPSQKNGKADIDLHLSAQHAQGRGHVLFLYVLERIRRLISLTAGVPLSWVRFASHFLSLVEARGENVARKEMDMVNKETASSQFDGNHTHTIHCDESSFARFHYSGVLWLTPQDELSGGEVEFFDSDERVWRRKVQPRAGQVAVFTSGWENIHRVTPVRHGRRWSLPFFASITPPFNTSRLAKACIRPRSSKMWTYCEDRLHDWLSGPDEDFD